MPIHQEPRPPRRRKQAADAALGSAAVGGEAIRATPAFAAGMGFGDVIALQQTAGNQVVARLIGAPPPRSGPVIQRAYWEKIGSEYVWHGGDEQPPKEYVQLSEPQKPNPNNKKKLYSIFGPAPKVELPKKQAKKKGGTVSVVQEPTVEVPKVDGPKPLKRAQALTQAKKAPALMETAEVQALLAASEMANALTPEVAEASAKAAEVACGLSTAAANELGVLLAKVAHLDDVAGDVGLYEAAARSASAAAAKFAAQAKRLADVVVAQKTAKVAEDKLEAAKQELKAAEERLSELTEEIEYLQTYLGVFDTDMALVGRSGFVPNESLPLKRLEILAGIMEATRDRLDTEREIEGLEETVDTLGKENVLAAEDVPVKELAVTTGAVGLPESKADLETTRALRTLAGGKGILAGLLSLPKFSGDKLTLKLYLEALEGKGLAKPPSVRLITELSATHTQTELGTIAAAVVGGADIGIAISLAKVDPKLTPEQVVLFAKVQRAAMCKLAVVTDLLAVRDVPLYATEVVLTQLATLAKGGTSAARMAEIILAEKTLPTDALVELTNLFDDYESKDEMVILAKMVKEGMKAGRTAGDVTKLIEELNSDDTTLPTAATVKLLLQAEGLAAFSMTEVAQHIAALDGLTGAQMVEVSTWLNALSPAEKLALINDVFVADGTPVAEIHGTFRIMNAARLTGAEIRSKIEFLRGFLASPGGDAEESITEVGGTKILTGSEIYAHAQNALTGPSPHTKVANLAKYPKGETPGTRHIDTLWDDADPTPRGTETAEEALRRQKFAIAEICAKPDVIREHVQQVLAYDYGAAPRPIELPAVEDGLDPTGQAHTNNKHTIGGGGALNNYYDLAARACYSPTAGGQASAFTSPADAQEAIQEALDDYVNAGNWAYLRSQFIKGYATAIDRPVGGDKAIWLRTTGGGGPNGLYNRGGNGTFNNQAAKPKNDGGKGGRHYYPGDGGVIPQRNGFVTRYTGNNAPFETFGQPPAQIPIEGTNLTTVIAATGVHLRLIGMNVDGGFVVNSAYTYE